MFEIGTASYYRYKDKWRINIYNYEPDEENYSTQQIETHIIERVIQRMKRVHIDYRSTDDYTIVFKVRMRNIESSKSWKGIFLPTITMCLKEKEYKSVVIRLLNPESLRLSIIRTLIKGNHKIYLDNEIVQLPEVIDLYPDEKRPLSNIDNWYKDLIRTVKADKDFVDCFKRSR